MYVAIDDTDSKSWMCTTFLAEQLIASLPDYDLIGLPRLVRLNPAVPWKTRGNGAICLRFGRGAGQNRPVGEIEGKEVRAFERSTESADRQQLFDVAMGLVEDWARVGEGASPGVVVSPVKPKQELYWKAVRDLVLKKDVVEILPPEAVWGGLNDGRGVIGASAAMSWRPKDRTYEILAYRKRDRWGTERIVDKRSIISMDRSFPSTFNNYDYHENKIVICPNSPCPVLYGIRGDNPDDLLQARKMLMSEEGNSHLLFLTNQATDDHVIYRWKELSPNRSYSIRGKVISQPKDLSGGHTIVTIETTAGPLDVTAYEPTKRFREIVRSLLPGDSLRVVGELREKPRTLNLEKLELLDPTTQWKKVSNPSCPSCGKRMKSTGLGKGYRCRRCGTRAEESSAVILPIERNLGSGWYEPPVSARRHLSKPLKRMSKS
ncbi:MAG TPA: tRNA(Ile)(2)-agmatinylcytidine synthase [Methanomassiliicoccales archaeon]|nr:tRNA(Ile)(2)-agmatinylcytidine synthase [Methanomassiliicoccales archaeon]